MSQLLLINKERKKKKHQQKSFSDIVAFRKSGVLMTQERLNKGDPKILVCKNIPFSLEFFIMGKMMLQLVFFDIRDIVK